MKNTVLKLRDKYPVLFPLTIFLGLVLIIVLIQNFQNNKKNLDTGKIAVLKVEGVILSSEDLLNKLESFEKNDEILGLILRINSPGGAVAPVQEVFDKLLKIREKKPVYSSVETLAASGGYYLAAASDRIFANKGSIIGSIGVIFQFVRYQELFKKIGLDPVVIKAGKYKDILSPYREVRPVEREMIQNLVDDAHQQFVADIASGRGLAQKEILPLADGRIFTAKQSLEYNLIDELGNLDFVVDKLKQELELKKVQLIYPKENWRDYLEKLGASFGLSQFKRILLPSGLISIFPQ